MILDIYSMDGVLWDMDFLIISDLCEAHGSHTAPRCGSMCPRVRSGHMALRTCAAVFVPIRCHVLVPNWHPRSLSRSNQKWNALNWKERSEANEGDPLHTRLERIWAQLDPKDNVDQDHPTPSNTYIDWGSPYSTRNTHASAFGSRLTFLCNHPSCLS